MTAASSRDCGVRRDVIVRGRRISYLEAGAGERTCVLIHGLAASWDSTRYPERVRRLVLSGGPITSVIDLFNHPVRTLLRRPMVASFLVEAITAGLRPPEAVRRLILTRSWARWLAFRAYVPRPADLSTEELSGVLFGIGSPGVLPTLRQGFGYDLRPALTAVRQPTIVINGELDTICPPADARAFAAANPAVRAVHAIPGVGHWPMLEAPETFNELVIDFLAGSADPNR